MTGGNNSWARVIGSLIGQNGTNGIELRNARYASIDANTLYLNGKSLSNRYSGILLSTWSGAGCLDCTVVGNICCQHGGESEKWGIFEDSNLCDYNTFTGNDVRGALGDMTKPMVVNGVHSRMENNMGYYPLKITNPFLTAAQGIGAFGGDASAPAASVNYAALFGDIHVHSDGGTGVSITFKDAAGNTIESGLSTLTNFPVPYRCTLNWGAFKVAPNVVVIG
jgi:hypothetical protein